MGHAPPNKKHGVVMPPPKPGDYVNRKKAVPSHRPPPNPESKPRAYVTEVPHEVPAPWWQEDGTMVVEACRACGRRPEKPVVLNRSQRTRCRDCGWVFTAPGARPEPPREVTDEEVDRAIEMALREFMAWPAEWDPMHVPDAVAQLELDIELALARVSGPEGCRFFSPFRTPKMTGDGMEVSSGAFWPFTSPNHAWRTALLAAFADLGRALEGPINGVLYASMRLLTALCGLAILIYATLVDAGDHPVLLMLGFVMTAAPLASRIEGIIEAKEKLRDDEHEQDGGY